MKFSKTFALAGLLGGSLILTGLTSTAAAHDNDNNQGNGKSKHYFCYDKHGRWRQHPHCPPPQKTLPHGHYYSKDYYHSHEHDYRRSGDRYQSQPQIIYVRKDGPFDRSQKTQTVARDSLKTTVSDARKEVQQGRDQLRKDQTELKNDRAELRRDIRAGASKAEIKADRQEIRSDVDKVKSTRREIREDRADLAGARRDLAKR
ncbi:MAG TPA: hypothetical protein VHV54_19155 [Candidatus Binatia bacterium]|nr:hypothetical protein [Candidatus Binatia bacterium]